MQKELSVNYSEPSWLIEPPEDTRKTLTECENCGQELLEGDTVYFTAYDTDKIYCSSECFIEGEKAERVLK